VPICELCDKHGLQAVSPSQRQPPALIGRDCCLRIYSVLCQGNELRSAVTMFEMKSLNCSDRTGRFRRLNCTKECIRLRIVLAYSIGGALSVNA
jgi:hypothetical protein